MIPRLLLQPDIEDPHCLAVSLASFLASHMSLVDGNRLMKAFWAMHGGYLAGKHMTPRTIDLAQKLFNGWLASETHIGNLKNNPLRDSWEYRPQPSN